MGHPLESWIPFLKFEKSLRLQVQIKLSDMPCVMTTAAWESWFPKYIRIDGTDKREFPRFLRVWRAWSGWFSLPLPSPSIPVFLNRWHFCSWLVEYALENGSRIDIPIFCFTGRRIYEKIERDNRMKGPYCIPFVVYDVNELQLVSNRSRCNKISFQLWRKNPSLA